MFSLILTAFLVSLGSSMAWAHGEDKPGPQGGYIRMPGAYHIELIPQAKGYKVRLLDMQFLRPTVQQSRLQMVWQQAGKSQALNCRPQANFFQCTWPQGKVPKEGQLKVTSQRLGIKGIEVVYRLPLAYVKPVSKGHQH